VSRSHIQPAVVESSELTSVYDRFAATVVRRGAVDPYITELVRLRCAQYHDCRLCGSIRLAAARELGLDEARVNSIDNYEAAGFTTAQKAALRLADAVIIGSLAIPDELRDELHRCFSDEQISELLFDVMKWSFQKALVSLRVEDPYSGGAGELTFDSDGNAIVDGRPLVLRREGVPAAS
jgi:alkylhydroperoxidase family enzyme